MEVEEKDSNKVLVFPFYHLRHKFKGKNVDEPKDRGLLPPFVFRRKGTPIPIPASCPALSRVVLSKKPGA